MNPMTVASTRDVLSAAWRVTRTNLWTIIAITLIVYVPIEVALSFVPESGDKAFFGLGLYFRIQRALDFWLGTIASAALVHVGFVGSREPKVSIGSAFQRGLERYGSALWGTFLYQLAVVVGFIVLVIPGIVVAVFWAFYLQAIVIHDKSGRAALKDSNQFVKGRWWRFFRSFVVLTVMFLFLVSISIVPSIVTPENRVLEVFTGILSRLCASFLIVCLTQLYLLSGGLEYEAKEDKLGAKVGSTAPVAS